MSSASLRTESKTLACWAAAGRIFLASAGGYALSSLCAAVLALALPHLTTMSPAMSVTVATMLSFAICTAVAIGVFGVRSAVRAWTSMAVATLVLTALYFALRSAG